MSSENQSVIYDLGANNGSNLRYYLMKADRVVAVEANPLLCGYIRQVFAAEIAEGRLTVENCVLTTGQQGKVDFYIHNTNHVLSQLPEPPPHQLTNFSKVELPARNVVDIIAQHGRPHFVKIDIEHYDQEVLRCLFGAGIFPDYVSAESHDIEVFCVLVALGGYQAFKLVDGGSVSAVYKDHPVRTKDGVTTHSFPHHSAGPFGPDVKGGWMTRNHFSRYLGLAGLGWKDIHASRVDAPDGALVPIQRYEVKSTVSIPV